MRFIFAIFLYIYAGKSCFSLKDEHGNNCEDFCHRNSKTKAFIRAEWQTQEDSSVCRHWIQIFFFIFPLNLVFRIYHATRKGHEVSFFPREIFPLGHGVLYAKMINWQIENLIFLQERHFIYVIRRFRVSDFDYETNLYQLPITYEDCIIFIILITNFGRNSKTMKMTKQFIKNYRVTKIARDDSTSWEVEIDRFTENSECEYKGRKWGWKRRVIIHVTLSESFLPLCLATVSPLSRFSRLFRRWISRYDLAEQCGR